jgi:hypothetical protein
MSASLTPVRGDDAPRLTFAPSRDSLRLLTSLKGRRAVATRREKTATSFPSVLCLAATSDWLRR